MVSEFGACSCHLRPIKVGTALSFCTFLSLLCFKKIVFLHGPLDPAFSFVIYKPNDFRENQSVKIIFDIYPISFISFYHTSNYASPTCALYVFRRTDTNASRLVVYWCARREKKLVNIFVQR